MSKGGVGNEEHAENPTTSAIEGNPSHSEEAEVSHRDRRLNRPPVREIR